jgi:hypothetical protein
MLETETAAVRLTNKGYFFYPQGLSFELKESFDHFIDELERHDFDRCCHKVKKCRKWLLNKWPGVTVDLAVGKGVGGKYISDFVNYYDADLLVVGSPATREVQKMKRYF